MPLKSDTLSGANKREPVHYERAKGDSILKPATKKNRAEVGEAETTIKVAATRACNIGGKSLAKGDTTNVTEDELAQHGDWITKVGEIVTKTAAVVVALLALLFFPAPTRAQTYNANQLIPVNTNNPWYSTLIGSIPDWIAGGAQLTNGIAGGTTNTSLFASTNLVSLTKYDQIVAQITFNQFGGSSVGTATNYVFFYPSADGINVDTNHPLATVTVTDNVSTNGILITNFNNTVLGSIGYVQVGVGSPTSGNMTTNFTVQFFGKPRRSG